MPSNLYKRCSCGKEAWSSCRHPWDYRFEYQGNKYRGPTGTADSRRAGRVARAERAKIEADPPRPSRGKGGLTLMELAAADLLEHEQRGVSAIHLRRLRDRVRVILKSAGKDTAASTANDHEWFRAYEGRRRAAGRKGQTIVREFQALGRWLIIAARRGAIGQVVKIPTVRRDPPDPKRVGKFRSPELVRQFLALLHEDARDEVMFVGMTGIRWGELKRLRADWIEPAPEGFGTPALLRFPPGSTKNGEAREVGVPPLALAIVQRRAAQGGPLVFARGDFKKHRERVSKKLGLEHNITLRDLRHTFASIAMQVSGDPTAVLRALGHKDLKMTERYLSSPLERVARLGPIAESMLLTAGESPKPDTEPDTEGMH